MFFEPFKSVQEKKEQKSKNKYLKISPDRDLKAGFRTAEWEKGFVL